jgi:multiple sugar transport system substrate-binding protein
MRNRYLRTGFLLVSLIALSMSAWAGGDSEEAVVESGQKIVVGVGGWAVEPTKQAVEELGFTEKTGIEVEVVTRPGAPPEFISQMASAILGGSSPYDVIDIEDDAAIGFSRSGWLVDMAPLFDDVFWSDWPEGMLEMVEVWHRYEGELFRMPHNYETQYFFYRKDLLDAEGLSVPTTWDEMVEVAKAMTDGDRYGVSDGLAQGAFLGVYITYLTQQAGGNAYEIGPEFRTALEFLYSMMHEDEVFPVSALNKDYDQVNNDYTQDRVVMMRQWPFFYDVVRGNKEWFEEDKAVVALPPAGPAGPFSYAGSWGWSIPKTADNVEGAKTFVQFMNSVENAPKLARINTWFLSARHSVLEEMGDDGMAKYLKMYSDAGAIGTRPFHPGGQEAHTIIEETAAAYLTNQMSLDQALEQGRKRMDDLEAKLGL